MSASGRAKRRFWSPPTCVPAVSRDRAPARQAQGGRESFVCGRLRWFGGDAVLWASLWGSGDRPQKPGVLAGGRGRRLLFLAPARRQLLLQILGSSRGSLADAGIWPAPGRPRPLPLGSASWPVPDPAFRLSWVRVGLTGQRRFLSPVLTRVQLSARRDRRGTGVCRHQL